MPLFLPNGGVTAPLTLASGTITADAPAINLTQTWNNGAVVFHVLQVEATTTANAAGSTLLRLRANGSTVASVSNGGTLTCSGNGTFTTGTLTLGTTVLLQDVSVNNLALRNSTNAQTFNLYGTYTDASNYRRIRTTMTTGGAVTIAAEGLGTGLTGNTFVLSSNGSAFITASSANIFLGGILYFGSYSRFSSPANGEMLLGNQALSDADQFLKLGVNTSAAAGIKRVGTTLQARLNDDSAYASIETLRIRSGAGTPEGAITAPVGAIYFRTDGGASTTLYVKESGAGNTGWVAK